MDESPKKNAFSNIFRRLFPTKTRRNVDDDYQIPLICSLPNEILQYIIKQLPRRDLFRCREVCVRWKEAIDYLAEIDEFWRELCRRDHKDVCSQARSKCRSNLSWRNLYISLSLWPKLEYAKETCSELKLEGAEKNAETTDSHLHVWKGTAAVHKVDSVVYYDLEKFEEINRIKLCNYQRFQENDDVAAYLYGVTDSQFKQLRIIPKEKGNLLFENMLQIDNVGDFIIFHDDLYYDSFHKNDIRDCLKAYRTGVNVCNLKAGFKCSLLQKLDDDVFIAEFGCAGNNLHFMSMFDNTVYTLKGRKFIACDTYDCNDHFYKSCQYGATGKNVLVYGEFVITARRSDWTIDDGTLKIYHLPSLINKNPKRVKCYDIKTLFHLQYDSEIINIDVMEKENGHVVIILTPRRILSLSLDHDFNLTPSTHNGHLTF